MFRLCEMRFTKAGFEARIVATDANFKSGAKVCTILALISVPSQHSASGQIAHFYTDDGKWAGQGNTVYDLLSNEPSEEEKKLIASIQDIAEGSQDGSREEALLKVIRALRKK